jgi:uncharacterized protein YecE (DUF72 family)
MSKRKPEIRIGTSGYQYDHWKNIFYPEKLSKNEWLDYYSERFDTVEINNTFYHLPSESSFDKWKEQAPPGFLYSLKFSRFATHMRKLKNPDELIERFLKLACKLKEHMGPILAQLPPRWHVNPERLSAFFDSVPSDRRWAIEFRDSSWLCEEIYSILRKHNSALCIHDLIEKHPQIITAAWTYLRFHGASGHDGNYSREQLKEAAEKIREYLNRDLDVYVYFNNDVHGYAINNALSLRDMIAAK